MVVVWLLVANGLATASLPNIVIINADDLACVTTIEDRDIVLAELNTLPGDLDGNGDVAFADSLTGWVSGLDGLILKTTTGGW